jgi:putative heme-binding domain-containing protein
VLARATDPAPRVRYQLAFTLGALPFDADVLSAFDTLLTDHADDVWMRTAALTSLNHPLVPILERLTAASGFATSQGGATFVGQMLRTFGARGQRAELDAALGFMDGVSDERLRLTFARDLFGGFARGNVPVEKADPAGRLAGTIGVARRLELDGATEVALRVTALELLAQDPRVDHVPFLAVVQPTEPQAVQAAALAALRQRDHPDVAPALVSRWGALTPRLRQDALGLLIARPDRALLLLEALRTKTVVPSDLTAGQAQTLLNHPDAAVARVAAGLLTLGTSTRQQVVDAYLPALERPADAARGRVVFANACASCHRLDDVGVDIGPNLLGVRNHGREGLLIDIFDPNRKVDPAYLFYEINLRGGDTLLGAIADETTETLTVAQAYGARTVVRRADIAGMRSVGQSMMPEGLESTMSQQEVADLLEYILTR